jgi:hypothetical protein
MGIDEPEHHDYKYPENFNDHEELKYTPSRSIVEFERRVNDPKDRWDFQQRRLPELTFTKAPSQSLSTRTKPGDRAKLAYFPSTKKRHFSKKNVSLLPNQPLSGIEKKRRKSLLGPREARFSLTVDAGWAPHKKRRQTCLFIERQGTIGNLVGLANFEQEWHGRSSTLNKRPAQFVQRSEPFYYSLEGHEDVFYRTFEHITKLSVLITRGIHKAVWDDLAFNEEKEICRTPIDYVKAHQPSGRDPIYPEPLADGTPRVYEVLYLACRRASPLSVIIREPKSNEPRIVLNETPDTEIKEYVFVIRRQYLYDDKTLADEKTVPISFLGYHTNFEIIPDTAITLAKRFPDFFVRVMYEAHQNPKQYTEVESFARAFSPRKRRWAFVDTEPVYDLELKSPEIFLLDVEPLLFTEPDLFVGTGRRLKEGVPKKRRYSILDYDEQYLRRICEHHSGHLRWRLDWKPSERTAIQDAKKLSAYIKAAYVLHNWIYVFCAALIRVALTRKERRASAENPARPVSEIRYWTEPPTNHPIRGPPEYGLV